MSKILLFTDIHLCQHKKSTERLDDCLATLEWIFQTAAERNIDNILFLGDLFHQRQKIEAYTYIKVFKIFEKYFKRSNNKIYLLLGNHDLWFYQKYDISSVIPLRAFDNVVVVDSPCTLNLKFQNNKEHPFSFLPYTHDPITDIKNIKNNHFRKVLVGHIAVDGAILNAMHGTHSEVAIEHDGEMVKCDINMFSQWDRVFLGHYHAEQKITDKVEYVGSPLELNFGEAFQEKHIIIYDIETDEREYIVNNFSPKHYIIPERDIDKYSIKNNFIKVVSDDLTKTKIIELKNDIMNQMPGSIEFVVKPKAAMQDSIVIEDAKSILLRKEEMLERFVSEMNNNNLLGNLDTMLLLKIGNEICQDVGDVDE